MLSGFLSFWSRKLELSGLNIGLPSGPNMSPHIYRQLGMVQREAPLGWTPSEGKVLRASVLSLSLSHSLSAPGNVFPLP